MGILSGLLGGITAEADAGLERRAKAEAEGEKFERDQLKRIAEGDDYEPEVRQRAATALLEIAANPQKRGKTGSFLSRLVGTNPIEPHPSVRDFYRFIEAPQEIPGLASRTTAGRGAEGPPNPPAQAAAPPPPPQGAAAMAPTPMGQPGGGPPSVAMLGSPGGQGGTGAPPPPLQVTPGGLPATRAAIDAQTPVEAQAPPTVVPRRILRDPGEMVRTRYVNEAQGQVEGRIAGRIASGMTREEALALERRQAAGGSLGAVRGAVAGQLPNGDVAYASQDLRVGSPTFNKWLDDDGNIVEGFVPRTTSASTSSGVNRDGAARALFGVSYAQLKTPEDRAKADAYAVDFAGRLTGSQTAGRMDAAAVAPLSTEQRAQAETTQRSNLERFLTSYRTAEQMGKVVETGYTQYADARQNGRSVSPQSQAIVQSFARLLDTLSSVREPEYNRTGDNQSIMSYAEGKLTKWAQGGAGLADSEVAEIVKLTRDIVGRYQSFAREQASTTQQFARTYGLNIANILSPDLQGLLNTQGQGQPPPQASPGVVSGSNTPPPSVGASPSAGAPKVGDVVGNVYTGERRTDAQGNVYGQVDGRVVPLRQLQGQWYY